MRENYKFDACMVECNVKKYIDHCKCIPFYYPHTGLIYFCWISSFWILRRLKWLAFVFLLSFQAFPEFAKIRQCGVSSVECIYNMSIIISTPELPESLVTSHINETCDCLANCQETVRQFIDNYYWIKMIHFVSISLELHLDRSTVCV